jgi:hypothetical protein
MISIFGDFDENDWKLILIWMKNSEPFLCFFVFILALYCLLILSWAMKIKRLKKIFDTITRADHTSIIIYSFWRCNNVSMIFFKIFKFFKPKNSDFFDIKIVYSFHSSYSSKDSWKRSFIWNSAWSFYHILWTYWMMNFYLRQ